MFKLIYMATKGSVFPSKQASILYTNQRFVRLVLHVLFVTFLEFILSQSLNS